ncbi:uncharacterized protein PV06_05357 [Exophiala oligosperma]|uniref:Uncharacterized protein n=1 Tax=Exophiala oligosperma TaxID=215243 RepID=A0A0D2DN61_9EURO|nr:uncharacterized protein PV06_05357 [Exophiala oligosperma]KIW44343.1 hypothetical protein PV06_05357 [Exophiala oligosperma]
MLKDPLWDFEKLGNGIHLYEPPATSTPSLPSISGAAASEAQPTLIICCVWMFAAARHAAKYFHHYQLLYPEAQILLLQNNIMNITIRPDRLQIQAMTPAVEAVKESIRKNPHSHILVHAFSGGGCHSVVQLAQAYRENIESVPDARDLPLEIPISAMVLDSSPPHGSPPLQTAVTASLSFLPKASMSQRLLATPVAWAVIGSCALLNDLGLVESSPSKIWRCLNDPEGPFLFNHDHVVDRLGFNPSKRTIPRTYIFSKDDQLVPHEHIVLHAAEASSKCEVLASDADSKESIRLEEFIGSAHVNHVSVDAQRYWQLVNDTVEKGFAMDEQTQRLMSTA